MLSYKLVKVGEQKKWDGAFATLSLELEVSTKQVKVYKVSKTKLLDMCLTDKENKLCLIYARGNFKRRFIKVLKLLKCVKRKGTTHISFILKNSYDWRLVMLYKPLEIGAYCTKHLNGSVFFFYTRQEISMAVVFLIILLAENIQFSCIVLTKI